MMKEIFLTLKNPNTKNSVYLGLSILDLSKNIMYDVVKCKTLLYGYRLLLCSCKNRRYLLYKDISKDVEKRFDTSNFRQNIV